MILQHTTNRTLTLISIAQPCNAATGRPVCSWMYEDKNFNDKKYWPGKCQT